MLKRNDTDLLLHSGEKEKGIIVFYELFLSRKGRAHVIIRVVIICVPQRTSKMHAIIYEIND